MGLDAHVYCRCIQDGKAKAHPFPGLLTYDPINGADLRDGATDEQIAANDKWFYRSCQHEAVAASERLGNMTWIAEVREVLRGREKGKDFPVLLRKVVYNGIHSGDHLSMEDVIKLQKEIAKAKLIRLPDRETSKMFKDFVRSIDRLCKASIKTGNPIVF
jgi:hypothetical protein